MLNTKKKMVFINGTVMMPLKVNERAVIYHDGGKITTSVVVNIKEVSNKSIIFETLNSLYCVVPELISETMIMDKRMPVCA